MATGEGPLGEWDRGGPGWVTPAQGHAARPRAIPPAVTPQGRLSGRLSAELTLHICVPFAQVRLQGGGALGMRKRSPFFPANPVSHTHVNENLRVSKLGSRWTTFLPVSGIRFQG